MTQLSRSESRLSISLEQPEQPSNSCHEYPRAATKSPVEIDHHHAGRGGSGRHVLAKNVPQELGHVLVKHCIRNARLTVEVNDVLVAAEDLF
ncbi:hypothetical protein [Stieleria mannarensis]|uniref:hypothetical protein n=1 Tax=Stieleria mannarensis TaxID=2755585 RepID=UPI0015FF6ACA|nr:hypothetical protein [Rhodopirellula sp. JC639]